MHRSVNSGQLSCQVIDWGWNSPPTPMRVSAHPCYVCVVVPGWCGGAVTSPLRSTSPMPAKVCVGHSEENTRRYYPLLLSHVTRMLTPFQVMPGVLLLSLSGFVFFLWLLLLFLTQDIISPHILWARITSLLIFGHTHTPPLLPLCQECL